jgi:hypothetical protein
MIKNQDGTVFRLNGPNPMMKTQSLRIKEPIIYNFFYEEFVSNENYQNLNDIQPEEIKVERKETHVDPSVIVKYIKTHPDTPHTLFHCLPATIEESVDYLYNEVRKSITYNEKFTFEGFIMESGDVSLSVWTKVPIEKIGKESIIFSNKRWWKVKDIESKAKGMIINCDPSEFTPSFEE